MAPRRAAVVVRRCSSTVGIITPASIQTLPVVVWPRAPLAARPCVSLVCARECVRPKIRHDAPSLDTRGKARKLSALGSRGRRACRASGPNTFSCLSPGSFRLHYGFTYYAHPDYAPLFPARGTRRSSTRCTDGRRPAGGRGSHATSFIKTRQNRQSM